MKKPKIAKPLKGKELKEERDERLHEEIVQDGEACRFGEAAPNDQERPKRRRVRDIRDKGYEKRHGIERVLGGLQGTGGVDGFEGHHARGYKKEAGKHTAGGVLVSRSGYVRNLPDDVDHELWGQRADELPEIAKRELRGRNATVFEGLMFHGRTVADLAHQFGVPAQRIYRIQNENKIRLTAALKGEPIPRPERRINWDAQMEEDRQMIREVIRQLRADEALLRKILSRSAAVERLFSDAEAAWHQTHRNYVCRTVLLKGYWTYLQGLIRQANDPALSDPRAPYVIGESLHDALPACRVTCECGGEGPHVSWEVPNWWYY